MFPNVTLNTSALIKGRQNGPRRRRRFLRRPTRGLPRQPHSGRQGQARRRRSAPECGEGVCRIPGEDEVGVGRPRDSLRARDRPGGGGEKRVSRQERAAERPAPPGGQRQLQKAPFTLLAEIHDRLYHDYDDTPHTLGGSNF